MTTDGVDQELGNMAVTRNNLQAPWFARSFFSFLFSVSNSLSLLASDTFILPYLDLQAYRVLSAMPCCLASSAVATPIVCCVEMLMICLKLYKGSGTVQGRRARHVLYDEKLSSFESDDGAYQQADATGFIKLNALRLKTIAKNRQS